MLNKQHTVFITGAAGYVGAMLCEQYSLRSDVAKIVALDKEEQPDSLKNNPKISWITANTADRDVWYARVKEIKPNIVIHTAWQIREIYGNRALTWRWNVEGSKNIFTYAFENPSVERLVHFSTASIYGAFPENTLAHYFTESEPMREKEYIYAVEKQKVEEILTGFVNSAQAAGTAAPLVSVVRPAAITGPRGRFARIRFGLQAALAGQLRGNVFYKIVSLMVSYVPATKGWVRQFIHEDDVTDIVATLAFSESVAHQFEIFNITPPGEPVFPQQMGEITGKKLLMIQPWMARFAFFMFWHISRGKIPNGRGVWRFYCYPILMDGTKLTRLTGYAYQYNSRDAFRYTDGRYESAVPDAMRKKRTI